jgi:hypothetical protein
MSSRCGRCCYISRRCGGCGRCCYMSRRCRGCRTCWRLLACGWTELWKIHQMCDRYTARSFDVNVCWETGMLKWQFCNIQRCSVVPGVGCGLNDHPKFQSFDKAELNSQFRGKYIHNNLIGILVSLICKVSRTPD